jgi:glycosyltransferase involved in cell wall biosynthesis
LEEIKNIEQDSSGVIVYITPHLSTGGLPQYLLKKIERFSRFSTIYCVEYSYYGASYVVQRDKISRLLGDRFISLGEKSDLIKHLKEINPDIVHFEEIVETFVDDEILSQIYRDDRKYYICETCHSSDISPSIKRFYPDKFIMVSPWIKNKFEVLNIPSEILEYPIEKFTSRRDLAIRSLSLDVRKKHVINVGLFTSGKNQSELIEYARALANLPIEFHFIGNQAPNFSDYWGPLMNNLPPNCRIWGERPDVELFYQIADLFVFTSNFELNPLCVKESLSWGNKILLKPLETYMSIYDDNPNVGYLTDDKNLNVSMILQSLELVKKID